MGLQKSLPTPFGFTADYWRVDHIKYFDERNMNLSAEMHGFQTKEDSDAGHNRVSKITISSNGNEFHSCICSGGSITDARDWVYRIIASRNQEIIDATAEQATLQAIAEENRTDEEVARLDELTTLLDGVSTNPRYLFNGSVDVIE